MKIGSAAWNATINDGALEFGVSLSPTALSQITLHAGHLLQWNRKMNLTAITEPFEMAIKHYVDSIALAKCFSKPQSSPPKLLDIGSGGGFPGLVVKFIIPEIEGVLIDASRKKVSFLNFVIRTLKLNEIDALHTRAESYSLNNQNYFDYVVCRAFSKLDTFIDLALPFLAPQGKIIALKGGRLNDELSQVKKKSNILLTEVNTYTLPNIESKRSIVVIQKKQL